MKLHWQIGIALILAIGAGLASGPDGMWVPVFGFIGTLFLNALKMLIVPLIVASIINALMGLDNSKTLGRLGLKTTVYYLSTSFLAIVTGLFVTALIQPGISDGKPVAALLGLSDSTATVLARVEGAGAGDIVSVLLRMVPTNVIAAAAEGQMLGLIFFSLLFGFFITRLRDDQASVQRGFWAGLYEVMMHMTNFVMRFAPIGVFGLVAKVIAVTGWDAFGPLAWFFISVLLALAIHVMLTLPLLLKWIGGVSPLRHVKAMSPAILTAFSTSSSAATLPVTMECVEERAGVSSRTSGFVLPLGATINMDGTALYECVAALFIAQAYGLELTLGVQFTVVMVALLTSIGVAGIPSASLVAIAVILGTIGLPLEGIGLILAVDRVLDMCRTSVNVFSDSCGAVIIARREGETGVLSDSQTPSVTR